MKTIPIGRSACHVSFCCLGCATYGTLLTKEASFQLLDTFLESGGDFIDTANSYAHWLPNGSGGESESIIGQWLVDRRVRQEITIATKVGFSYPGIRRGLKSSTIVTECEKSLRRLRLDVIDLYYAHGDDRTTPLQETLQAFSQLITQGKVRYIGASNYSAWRMTEALHTSDAFGLPHYICLQQKYSFIRPRLDAELDFTQQFASRDVLDLCRSRQVSVIGYSVLLNGFYADPSRSLPPQYDSQQCRSMLRVLDEVAQDTGATRSQVVMAYLHHQDPPILPIIGASKRSQLIENLAGLELALNCDQIKRLQSAISPPCNCG
jgi:aryl-alcohol dehydrogenase-like predicted oxidoreductase